MTAAYVGIDNRAADVTAAYLVGRWLAREPGEVPVTPYNMPQAPARTATGPPPSL